MSFSTAAPAASCDLFGVGGAAVDVEAEVLGGGRAAGVAQADPGVEAAAPGLDGQPDDGPVGGPRPGALVVGAGREERLLLVGEPAVGQEDEAHRRPRRLHALGQVEGGGEVGRARRGADGADGGGECVRVGAGREGHPRLGVGDHHAGHPSPRDLAAQVAGLLFGRIEAVGTAVGGGHRPRRVEDEHRVLGQPGRGGAHRLGHRRRQESDGQELDGQEGAGAELLPGRRHRHGPGHRLPQEGRAHLHRRPPGPEDVQDDDRHRQESQPEPGRVGEPHARPPPRPGRTGDGGPRPAPVGVTGSRWALRTGDVSCRQGDGSCHRLEAVRRRTGDVLCRQDDRSCHRLEVVFRRTGDDSCRQDDRSCHRLEAVRRRTGDGGPRQAPVGVTSSVGVGRTGDGSCRQGDGSCHRLGAVRRRTGDG